MSEETQRICADCGHPKRGHELPRSEGGHGGGDSGRCVAYGCGCPFFRPTEEFKEQEYIGDPMPKWVANGVKVKVKRLYPKFSMSTHGGDAGWGHRVEAGEVGTIERNDGIGWWDYGVTFRGGRRMKLGEEELQALKKVGK